jgi:hypothetical protein
LTRLRDWLVCRIAEAIAEQRTLWSLRTLASATFIYPSDLSETSAAAIRGTVLIRARRHHGWWLLINVVGVALTAVLVLLPGRISSATTSCFVSWPTTSRGVARVMRSKAFRGVRSRSPR